MVRKLRILGFDALYWRGAEPRRGRGGGPIRRADASDPEPEDPAKAGRPGGVVVEANDPRDQLREVVQKLSLDAKEEKFFCRCLLCNEELRPLRKEEAEGRVPDFILQAYKLFHACPRCRRVYWPGTHSERMKQEMGGMTHKEQ